MKTLLPYQEKMIRDLKIRKPFWFFDHSLKKTTLKPYEPITDHKRRPLLIKSVDGIRREV